MQDACGRFNFVRDTNGDGVFSISDIWGIIEFCWFLPAKVVTYLLSLQPTLASFFEINCATGTTWVAGILCFFAWGFIFNAVGELMGSR